MKKELKKTNKKDNKTKVEAKQGEDKNISDKEKSKENKQNLKKDLERIKNERNLTDDEIVEINRLLEKIGSNEKRIILSRKDINKKTVFHVIRKIFFSYLLYSIVYFAMFGLFSKWFSFHPKHIIGYITLGYAAYMVLFRYICRLITEKTNHYISIYNIFSLITILLIQESGKLIAGYNIEGFMIIVLFYYFSEIIITSSKRYLFKYLPSKLMWRNKK